MMKRYSIPALFFLFGLICHFWLSFSTTTLLLLGITSLLLGLFVWSISEILEWKKGTSQIVDLEPEEFALQKPEDLPVSKTKLAKLFPPYFQGNSPDSLREQIRRKKSRQAFFQLAMESKTALPLGVSEAVYYFPEGDNFSECLWQKKDLKVASEGDGSPLPFLASERLKEGLSFLNEEEELYLPLSCNGKVLGAVRFTFLLPDQSAIPLDTLLEHCQPLAEALYDYYIFEFQKRDPDRLLFSQKAAKNKAIELMSQKRPVTLIALSFGKGQEHFDLLLDDWLEECSGLSLPLYIWDKEVYLIFADTGILQEICDAIQGFIEDADKNNHPIEIILGFASSKMDTPSLDTWFQRAIASLEESKLLTV